MNIMAFDSSAKVASVAVCSETEILAEFSTNTGLTHSQTLLPMAEQVLACANISMEQIDAFAVASGPGSFTGLRIGISAVKGMAQVLDKPCIGVSTLEGLIHHPFRLRHMTGKPLYLKIHNYLLDRLSRQHKMCIRDRRILLSSFPIKQIITTMSNTVVIIVPYFQQSCVYTLQIIIQKNLYIGIIK